MSPALRSALIAFVVSMAVIWVMAPPSTTPAATGPASAKESTFDRILRTGEIRCGYYVFPPVTYRDPKTSDLSGFSVDMMNEIASRSGLKIKWAEEISWVSWTESLKGGRFDVACTPMWPDIPLRRVVTFSDPLFYGGLYPMVRADDTRFKDESTILDRLNQPDVTFSVQEGDSVDTIVKTQFPKAKVSVLPKTSELTAFVMDLLTKKADVILTDANGKVEFSKANPGKLRFISSIPPIKLQPMNLGIDKGDPALKEFLDGAISDLQDDGTLDRLLRKWEPEPGITFLRIAAPYEKPTADHLPLEGRR